MKLFYKFMLLNFFIVTLSACSNKQFGYIQDGIDQFSYIQWDKNHAVTVRHVKQIDKFVYVSGKFDIQFFKHQEDDIPKWGNYISNDPIVSGGFVNGKYIEVKGYDMGLTLKIDDYPTPVYRATSAKIVHGMAGGPVFNEVGEVIGINIGLSREPVKYGEDYYNVSVYLPYEIIKNEWDNYQEIIKN